MIDRISSSDLISFIDYCQWRDKRQDFYVEKNGERLYLDNLQNAKTVFNECLKWKNLCYVSKQEGRLNGILLTCEDSYQPNRHFVKILSKSLKTAEGLLRVLLWNEKKIFYVRIKKYNPLRKIFKKFKFTFVKEDGVEIILCHLPRKVRKNG